MTREINGRIRMVVSDDGTRCAAECPWRSAPIALAGIVHRVCRAHGGVSLGRLEFDPPEARDVRLPACIAAEQAAASVPSCEVKSPGSGYGSRHERRAAEKLFRTKRGRP